jgi:hypothetical protein
MNEGKDFFHESKEEYRELNNELFVPAYQRFCKELDIPFHFWDELPKESSDRRGLILGRDLFFSRFPITG